MRRKHVLTAMGICLTIIVSSQDVHNQSVSTEKISKIDSLIDVNPKGAVLQAATLRKEAKKAKDYTLEAKALQLKARALHGIDKNEEAAFANMECANTLIHHEIADSLMIAKCYFESARNYFHLGLFDLSKELALTSLNYIDTPEINQIQISAFSLLGDVYLRQGDFESSLIYYDSCYQIDLHLKDTTYISADLTMLGRINTRLGRREEGLTLIKDAFDILDKDRHRSALSIAYNALGLAYSNLNEFEPANKNILKALEISEEINEKVLTVNRLVNLCNLHTKFKKYDSGDHYCHRCLDLMADDFEPNRYTIVHQNLGKIYYDKGKHEKAQQSLKKALAMAKRGSQLPQIKEIYQTMAQQYLENDEPNRAFEYMEKYQNISDSIFSLNAHVKANALKFKYESAKKEAEIKSLKLTNEVKERDFLSLKARQRGILFFSIMLGTIGLFSFLFYRQKKKNELRSREVEINQQLSLISTLQKDVARALDQSTQNVNSLSLTELNRFISTDLSEREYEILELVLNGYSNQEVADKVFLSINTVKFHLKKIYAKLDVSNRLEVMQLLLKK